MNARRRQSFCSAGDVTRFARKLTERVCFLQRSSLIFYNGGQDEALRVEVSMRALFWHKGRNLSLISHLHLPDGRMLSTSRGHGDYRDYRLDLMVARMSIGTWRDTVRSFPHGDSRLALLVT